MTLLIRGSARARRGIIAAMRITATASGSRPFTGIEADLVRAMAKLLSHHHLEGRPVELSDLLGEAEPWKDPATALRMIDEAFDRPEDRREAAHAAFLVALMADDPDGDGLRAARQVALAVIALQWHQGIRLGVVDPARAVLDPNEMVEAARRGDETSVDLTDLDGDWMSLLELPLEQARSMVGVPPGGSWRPGGRWDAGLHRT